MVPEKTVAFLFPTSLQISFLLKAIGYPSYDLTILWCIWTYLFNLLTGHSVGESVVRVSPLLRELSCATLSLIPLRNFFLPLPVIPTAGCWVSSTVPTHPPAFLTRFPSVLLYIFSERFPHTSSSSSSLTLLSLSEITFLILKSSLIRFLLIPSP